jgi:predicted  nucleic acid-binding Zn-ribbon protein
VTAAEKRLAQATAAVEDARARLRGAEVEKSAVYSEATNLDSQIRAAIYSAAAAGDTNADVTADRARLGRLVEQVETLQTVTQALEDGVRRAEQARNELICDEFPQLRAALVPHADKLRAEREEMWQRHAAEEAEMSAKIADLERQWHELVLPLPSPLRPGGMTSDLRLPMTEAAWGLADYVPEPNWPSWGAAIIEQSRQIRDNPAPIGIPVAP